MSTAEYPVACHVSQSRLCALELGPLPAQVPPAHLDRPDRDGLAVLRLVHGRPDAPRAPVVQARRLELGPDAPVLDEADEERVVADLELVDGRALRPGEGVLV